MSNPLIPTGMLISDSWQSFTKHWKETFNISVWFLLPPALLLAATFLARAIPGVSGGLLIGVCNLVGVIIAIHTSLRLIQFVLAKDRGETLKTTSILVPWGLFFSYLWIAILSGLAVAGGFILFILPGIWLSVGLWTSSFLLLEDGKKGTQALAGSMALIKGRWWATFGRLLAAGIVFGLLIGAAVIVVAIILGLIGGFGKLLLILQNQNNAGLLGPANPLAIAFQLCLQAITQVVFAPLIITWQAKLFHSLKATR